MCRRRRTEKTAKRKIGKIINGHTSIRKRERGVVAPPQIQVGVWSHERDSNVFVSLILSAVSRVTHSEAATTTTLPTRCVCVCDYCCHVCSRVFGASSFVGTVLGLVVACFVDVIRSSAFFEIFFTCFTGGSEGRGSSTGPVPESEFRGRPRAVMSGGAKPKNRCGDDDGSSRGKSKERNVPN